MKKMKLTQFYSFEIVIIDRMEEAWRRCLNEMERIAAVSNRSLYRAKKLLAEFLFSHIFGDKAANSSAPERTSSWLLRLPFITLS